jgi:hypothetical protein
MNNDSMISDLYIGRGFYDYIKPYTIHNLHDKLNDKVIQHLPKNIADLKHIVIYGPIGCGKYTQALSIIRKYSTRDLKYEKKITVSNNKQLLLLKLSDIHFEVDFSILGCNSKVVWNDLYYQIREIVSAMSNKIAIVLCKNIQCMHNELLDCFYTYMQTSIHHGVHLRFILITEQVSFLPNNILNTSYLIPVSRPSKTYYMRCLSNADDSEIFNYINVEDVTNINLLKQMDKLLVSMVNDNDNDNSNSNTITELKKSLFSDIKYKMKQYIPICNELLEIIKSETINHLRMRELIYEIFIHKMSIYDCMWYILNEMINYDTDNSGGVGGIEQEKYLQVMDTILKHSYTTFRYYNNNYRPIYHIENWLLNVREIIHT